MCYRELVSIHSNAALQTKSSEPNIDNVWENILIIFFKKRKEKKRKAKHQWQTSLLCVCKKGLGKVKNRNTLLWIVILLTVYKNWLLSQELQPPSWLQQWRSLWHLACFLFALWVSSSGLKVSGGHCPPFVWLPDLWPQCGEAGAQLLSMRRGERECCSAVRSTSTVGCCRSNRLPARVRKKNGQLKQNLEESCRE